MLGILAPSMLLAIDAPDIDPQRYINPSGFVGFVPDRFIVVLKDEVSVDHSRDLSSSFEVTDVTHATHTYDAGANLVTRACESGWVYGTDRDIFALNGTLPEEFELSQNYPNPFNPTTEIVFSLPTETHVRLEVFNVLGQSVDVLVDRSYSPGTHMVTWNAGGQSSGVYFYRITTDEQSMTRKMLLLK
jgi:hypothetical protein